MNKETIKIVLILVKRVLGFSAITLWLYVIYGISQSPAPFIEQAPYCMISTMLIFGLLSMSYKGLEFWEKSKT